MSDGRITLITGANKGVGFKVAKELAEAGNTVLVGSWDLKWGEEAARQIGSGAVAIQIDVTDAASVAAAAEHIKNEYGRLDLLVNNAGISNTSGFELGSPEFFASAKASTASLDDPRGVGHKRVRCASGVPDDAATAAGVVGRPDRERVEPRRIAHRQRGPVVRKAFDVLAHLFRVQGGAQRHHPGMLELEDTDFKVNLVSPEFTATDLNNFMGTSSVEEGSREVVRVGLFGADDPRGTYARWENSPIPW